MPPSNVEIVREMVAVFNRAGGEAALDYGMGGATNLVWRTAQEWPGKPVYEGREGALELIEEWTSSFDEYRWEVERSYDLGDRVLTLVHHRGRTGVTWLEGQVGAIWRLEDGVIVETWFFFSWAAALAAAGIEQPVN